MFPDKKSIEFFTTQYCFFPFFFFFYFIFNHVNLTRTSSELNTSAAHVRHSFGNMLVFRRYWLIRNNFILITSLIVSAVGIYRDNIIMCSLYTAFEYNISEFPYSSSMMILRTRLFRFRQTAHYNILFRSYQNHYVDGRTLLIYPHSVPTGGNKINKMPTYTCRNLHTGARYIAVHQKPST